MARKKKLMTYKQLEELVQQVLPTADIDEDYEGQLVIYTNLTTNRNGDVVMYEPT